MFIEICAGSAVLSAAACEAGFSIFPIDCARNKFHTHAAVLTHDLASPSDAALVVELIQQTKPRAVHFGLPCGTCSRARERPVAKRLRATGAPSPRPLRDHNHLFGLPDLSPREQEQIDAANLLYRTAVSLLVVCFHLQCIVSIENPRRSWLWQILAVLVKQHSDVEFRAWYFAMVAVHFDACMHGGLHDKATTFLCVPDVFDSLSLQCDGQHQHAEWTIDFHNSAWSSEAEYPRLLCQRYVACLLQRVEARCLASARISLREESLAMQNRQHRRSKQLIPEYLVVHDLPSGCALSDNQKIVRPHIAGAQAEVDSAGADKAGGGTVKVGTLMPCEEHVKRALALEHPMDVKCAVPDQLRVALFNTLTKGASGSVQHMAKCLSEDVGRAVALTQEEKALKAGLHPSVRAVVDLKRLKLLELLLEETRFPDMKVLDALKHGVSLTGVEPESSLFAKRFAPRVMDEETLNSQALWRRKRLMGSASRQDSDGRISRLSEISREEVDLGFLQGPFTEEQVTQKLGQSDWSLNRRFLLVQGEEAKERVIDDFKESGVNQAYASSSWLELHDIDFVASFFLYAARLKAMGDDLQVGLSSGQVLRGRVHSSFKGAAAFALKCLDLSKAYKQVPLAPGSAKHAVLGVPAQCGAWEFYLSNALPFGASASVFEFNKLSRALWWILVVRYNILACSYYDDFPLLAWDSFASAVDKTSSSLLTLLGWRHALSGKKGMPFAPAAVVLGVSLDVSLLHQGCLTAKNTEHRIKRISLVSAAAGLEDKPRRSDYASLHGLLNYASGFVLGLSLKLYAKWCSGLASGQDCPQHQRARLHEGLQLTLARLKPKVMHISDSLRPCVLYTDGAFEGESATWGATLFPASGQNVALHGHVPDELKRRWLTVVGKQIIAQVEMFGVLCGLAALKAELSGQRVILFVDNEACRYAVVKRATPNPSMFALLQQVSLLEAECNMRVWVERVPSYSNPADLPSRLQTHKLPRPLRAQDRGGFDLPRPLWEPLLV